MYPHIIFYLVAFFPLSYLSFKCTYSLPHVTYQTVAYDILHYYSMIHKPLLPFSILTAGRCLLSIRERGVDRGMPNSTKYYNVYS